MSFKPVCRDSSKINLCMLLISFGRSRFKPSFVRDQLFCRDPSEINYCRLLISFGRSQFKPLIVRDQLLLVIIFIFADDGKHIAAEH